MEIPLRLGRPCAAIWDARLAPTDESGLPSRSKSWAEKGIGHVPVWGLVSEDILTLEGEVPPGASWW